MSLKNLSMRSRLLLSLVPTVICAILVSIQTYYASRQENTEIEAAMRMVEITDQQELAMVQMSEALLRFLLDPSRQVELARKKEVDAQYVQLSEELSRLTRDNESIQKLNKTMAEFDATTLDEKENQLATMIQKKEPGALTFFQTNYLEARHIQVSNFQKLKDLVRIHSNMTIQNIKDRTYYAGIVSIAALWLGLILGLSLTAAVAFQVTKQTEKVFLMIRKVSDTVAKSSRSIQEEAGNLSEAVQRQACAIQETAASVNEISAMIKNNCDSAVDSRQHSKVCREHSDKGIQAFEVLLCSIEDARLSQQSIFDQVEQGHRGIAEINGIINQIDEKTRVIHDIVFQTKLLSFNASVEAARAGENGKGFAIVADEVGNLARMSGGAAQDITKLLSQSAARVSSIIESTQESVRATIERAASQLDSSIQNVQGFKTILTVMTQGVNQVDGKVDAISTASREQETAVSEISKVMHNLDADTQKSALIAHHTAVTAEQLKEQSIQLEQLVLRMTSLLHGGKKARKHALEQKTPPMLKENFTDNSEDADAFVDDEVA